MASILILHEMPLVCAGLIQALESQHEVFAVGTVHEAFQWFSDNEAQLFLLSERIPPEDVSEAPLTAVILTDSLTNQGISLRLTPDEVLQAVNVLISRRERAL